MKENLRPLSGVAGSIRRRCRLIVLFIVAAAVHRPRVSAFSYDRAHRRRSAPRTRKNRPRLPSKTTATADCAFLPPAALASAGGGGDAGAPAATRWQRNGSGGRFRRDDRSSSPSRLHSSSSSSSVSSSSAARASPPLLATSGDWSAYLDETKGLVYYFHRRTGESAWEVPEGTSFSGDAISVASGTADMRDRQREYLESRLASASAASFAEELASASAASVAEELVRTEGEQREGVEDRKTVGGDVGEKEALRKEEEGRGVVARSGDWTARIDEMRGLVYYHDARTNESTWIPPPDFPPVKLAASRRIALEKERQRYLREREEEQTKETKSSAAAEETVKKEEIPTVGSLPIVQQGNWSAHLDEKSGVVYYFHAPTGESFWNPPDESFPRVVMKKANVGLEEAETKANFAKDPIVLEEEIPSRKVPSNGNVAWMKDTTSSYIKSSTETMLKDTILDNRTVEVDISTVSRSTDGYKIDTKMEDPVVSGENFRERNLSPSDEAEVTLAKNVSSLRGEDSKTKEDLPPTAAVSVNAEEETTAVAASPDPVTVRTLYEILESLPDATKADLKRSYVAIARKTHPDARIATGGGATMIADDEAASSRFTEVSAAWKVLSDVTARRRYDRGLRAGKVSASAGVVFENWVTGAAKAMDSMLTKAENELNNGDERKEAP